MSTGLNYQTVLKSALDERKKRNPSYSLRAFAQFLGLSPAQVSQIISGRRPLTPKAALKIADRLGFSPNERVNFIESTVGGLKDTAQSPAIEIREEEFRLISDWHHYAILSLSEVKNSRSDPRWIARKLGITPIQAVEAMERLTRLGLIEIKDGRYRQINTGIRTSTEVPSAAIRSYHKQNLERAKEKIDEVPLEDREYSSITMAISRKKMPQAKKLITDFKRKLAACLEDGERDAVYTLAIQLFPSSKLEKQ